MHGFPLCFSSANATPEFEGRGGEELGVELSNNLYKVFNNRQSLDLRSLCICPGEHCWVLYVDVLVSSSEHHKNDPTLHNIYLLS